MDRSEKVFKKGHLEGAINIQNGGKFETWLGSIVGPDERYYLIAENEEELNDLIKRLLRSDTNC
jgi:hydroxyacylglutathione hydrolase